MADLVCVGDTSLRLSPEGSERLETATDVRMRATGTESSVAVAASRLGADARWLSKLPDSPLGRRVVAELHQHGIDIDVAWSETGRQGLTFYESANPPRETIRIDERETAAAATMTPGELAMDEVQSAASVFAAGSTMALSATAAETVQAILRAGGSGSDFAAFDLDYRPAMWSPEEARETVTNVFDAVEVLFATEDDVTTVLGKSGQARELAPTVAAEWDFQMVVITRSEHGALVYHDGVIHDCDAFETEAVDETGQHAAFIGGFLARLLEGADTDEALSAGVATAALTRTIPGPLTTVDRHEVERLVESADETAF
ncbi:MAG: sugar kinase [Halapricum sp.]